jgi:hypothetical protein
LLFVGLGSICLGAVVPPRVLGGWSEVKEEDRSARKVYLELTFIFRQNLQWTTCRAPGSAACQQYGQHWAEAEGPTAVAAIGPTL